MTPSSARVRSPHTRRAYATALTRLEAWCRHQDSGPVELTPALADDWIENEKAQGASPATVRLSVSGASAFFTWMERRHTEVRNPFRGTRSRPAVRATRALGVPSEDEINVILDEAKVKDNATWAAIVFMARLGLRVGALPELSISGDRYTTTSKGKELRGDIAEDLRQTLSKAGLPLRLPFGDLSASVFADRVRLITEKMHAEGRLRAAYSAHDLRHAFAIRLYDKTRDVYAVKTALAHGERDRHRDLPEEFGRDGLRTKTHSVI